MLETAVYGFGSGIKLIVRMKARYFLHNVASSVSLPFCLSELCGGLGCISCSVWVDRTCGKLRAQGVAADIQVSCRCNRWSCPGGLVNVLNEGVDYRFVWVTWRVVWSACFMCDSLRFLTIIKSCEKFDESTYLVLRVFQYGAQPTDTARARLQRPANIWSARVHDCRWVFLFDLLSQFFSSPRLCAQTGSALWIIVISATCEQAATTAGPELLRANSENANQQGEFCLSQTAAVVKGLNWDASNVFLMI